MIFEQTNGIIPAWYWQTEPNISPKNAAIELGFIHSFSGSLKKVAEMMENADLGLCVVYFESKDDAINDKCTFAFRNENDAIIARLMFG